MGPTCAKMGLLWATPIIQNFHFALEITKPDHKISKTFYFIKKSDVLTEL